MRADMLNRLEASLRDINLLLETDEHFDPHEVNRLTALSRTFIAAVSAWKGRQNPSERFKWSGQWNLQG
jgi:hypothetical protein